MNPIGELAVIGDCHSLALIGRDGTIDWACFPRFDSPSTFARTLDDAGGHFAFAPAAAQRDHRAYLPETNVLTTTWWCDGGVVEATDAMPVEAFEPDRPAAVTAHHSIIRRARCLAGRVELRVELAPRFEYGAVVPRFTVRGPHATEIVGGPDALWVRTTHPLVDEGGAVGGHWHLAAGEEGWIEVAWAPAHDQSPHDDEPLVAALRRRLDTTVAFWRAWMEGCRYDGIEAAAVHRSALVLKALTYAPSGAVVAAGTTSLPESVGGERNWDYRYTWIRDATLTLTSLMILGFEGEAAAFKAWLERTGAGRPEDLQIMYGICGERMLPELRLDHLRGHRDSRPVRIGNGAAKQMQLDSYGQILEAAWLYAKVGGELTPSNWTFLAGLADIVAQRWRLPDHGIWEIRDRPRHFVHSKLNCWVALDRAARLATAGGLPGAVDEWLAEREALRAYLLEEGAPNGWFRQAAEVDAADASTLFVPALGFLATTDPLVAQTIEVVTRDLSQDGLVNRYLSPDGLGGGEGAFLLCSF